MARHKPNRKRRMSRQKPEAYNPRNRAMRRAVNRKKQKNNSNDLRSIIYIIAVMSLVIAVMVISAYFIRIHEDMK